MAIDHAKLAYTALKLFLSKWGNNFNIRSASVVSTVSLIASSATADYVRVRYMLLSYHRSC